MTSSPQGRYPKRARRFQVHFGMAKDIHGYVVTDTRAADKDDYRGKVLFSTDSRGDAEKEAERLNEESSDGLTY